MLWQCVYPLQLGRFYDSLPSIALCCSILLYTLPVQSGLYHIPPSVASLHTLQFHILHESCWTDNTSHHGCNSLADVLMLVIGGICCTGFLAKVSAKTAWGFSNNEPPALQSFAVELDQRFLTELAHTAALFGDLFETSGRKQLLKVRVPCFMA